MIRGIKEFVKYSLNVFLYNIINKWLNIFNKRIRRENKKNWKGNRRGWQTGVGKLRLKRKRVIINI